MEKESESKSLKQSDWLESFWEGDSLQNDE